MVENHGCVKQTDVIFTCKCSVEITIPLYALQFIGADDHPCEYVMTQKMDGSAVDNDDAKSVKSTASVKSLGSNRSVGSNRSTKSIRSMRTKADVYESAYWFCFHCRTPVNRKYCHFQTSEAWIKHMEDVIIIASYMLLLAYIFICISISIYIETPCTLGV
nr:MAG: hypothetical protein [Lake Baikal virophage 9]